MLTRQTRDGAATTPNGLRRVKFDGSPALSLFRVFLLDATFEDAVVTLPPCVPNAGRLVWCKRVDSGTAFDAEAVPDGTSDTIQGDSSYDFPDQYSGVLLFAGTDGTWLIIARET